MDMNEKAIKYVINGMLNDSREIFVKRLAFILAALEPNVLNMLVNGVPVRADVDLTKFTKSKNARDAKCFADTTGVQVEYTYDEVRYRKPGTDDNWGRCSKNEEYTEEFLYPRCDSTHVRYEQCEENGIVVEYDNELPL